jgi:predicted secreted Zn-dependent protease
MLTAAMRFLACLVLALSVAAPARAEEAQKPNKIERAANKTAKGVERTVKRTGDWAERTGNRAGKAVERTVDKTENWVKKKLE